jgi:glycosyltransferase involved in cell wall biosynthesis
VTGDRLRVLITCGTFEPGFRGGGPVRSVAHIIDTASDRIDVVLVTRDRDLGATGPYPGLTGRWSPRRRARVFYLNVHAPRQWLRLWRDLRDVPFDLLYVNSSLSPLFTVLPIVAVRLRLLRCGGLLIAPRGELSAGALSLKATKKRVFLRCWGRLLAGMTVRWHASTAREAGEIRAVYPWADIDVGRNQVMLPPDPMPPTAGGRTARLAFIGRVSPIKNVHLTIEALRHVSARVEFDIYGPVEDRAYWSRCRSMIELLPGWVRVRYRGELAPDQVRPTFAGYDAFVFPTRGESFGHVIAESLSASCPVVCSTETPWSEVLTSGGGTVVRGDRPEDLGAELQRIAAMTAAQRLRARELAGDAYRTWRAGVADPNILDQVLRAEVAEAIG